MILALFKWLEVGTNLSPFERRETSSLERWRLDKLIMLAPTNSPSYLLLHVVAMLSFSGKCWLELSLSFLEVDKLGLLLLNILEFIEILNISLISMEEGLNVNKLTKFKRSEKKLSQKFFRSVKKVNKFECSQKPFINQPFRYFVGTEFLKFFFFFFLSPYYSFNFPRQMQNHLYQPFKSRFQISFFQRSFFQIT